jgi:hypothetical protein
MDAGIAAVLGAMVGALGTGGAGITAALLAKSQVRMQLKAEHARMIREPRKQAYASYAEAAKRDYERLEEARLDLAIAQVNEAHRADVAARIRTLLDESFEHQNSVLEEWEAQVYMEGPHAVVEATVELDSALVEFRSAILRGHEKLQDGEDVDLAAVEEKGATAHTAYLRYLYTASEALNMDGVLEPRRR